MLNSSLNLSLEAFAYQKKPSVLAIHDSDDDLDVQCLDDEIPGNRQKKRKARIESDDSDVEVSYVKHASKRKRVCVIDSDNEDGNGVKVKNDDPVVVVDSDHDDADKDGINDITADQSISLNESLLEEQILAENYAQVNNFLATCSMEQLAVIRGCSRSKAEKILSMRPFESSEQMIENIIKIKNFNSRKFIDGCLDYLNERLKFEELMSKCEELSKTIKKEILLLNEHVDQLPVQQPFCVNGSLSLKNYQIVGLNWLALLHQKNLNGILADQMGLGKTIQALTFIGYLLENGHHGPHVIVCPCSTLDNWIREFQTWLPEVSFVQYSGSQSERRCLRRDILEGEEQADVIISTFNIILSTKEDRGFFRRLNIQYLVLDEAHMIKNMKSERYKHLLRLQASRKLLLTGTPLQNDVMELIALLVFLMPEMFDSYHERIKMLFSRQNMADDGTTYEKELLPKVKKILEPFFLRRLKKDVLHDMPSKNEKIALCELNDIQMQLYKSYITEYKIQNGLKNGGAGMALLTKLRKVTNHPLLVRHKYTDEQLLVMAQNYVKSPFHFDSDVDCVYEDMSVMSDFELHKLCEEESVLKQYKLSEDDICECGKLKWLDGKLPKLKKRGDRVLLFSQFVIVLDILEEYLKIKKYRYLRIDGGTKGSSRQQLIDEYNTNEDIFIFLLSTRAGGLGINLTSANTVIFNDIDYNPYNDKQAEDRCHRVGQTREVTVYKCIGKDTIEENILKCGEKKLRLEKEVVGGNEHVTESDARNTVLTILNKSL